MRARSVIDSRSWLVGQYAHRNRCEPTNSEARLWEELRAGKRQVLIAERFIVDFLAPSVRLVVEVDGGYHARRRRADERRDAKLRRLGYRVLRIDAEPALRDVAEALARVRDVV